MNYDFLTLDSNSSDFLLHLLSTGCKDRAPSKVEKQSTTLGTRCPLLTAFLSCGRWPFTFTDAVPAKNIENLTTHPPYLSMINKPNTCNIPGVGLIIKKRAKKNPAKTGLFLLKMNSFIFLPPPALQALLIPSIQPL